MDHHTKSTAAAIISILILSFGLGSIPSSAQSEILKSNTAATISCLRAKLSSIGGAPPQNKDQAYEVKVLFGRLAPGDQSNEIHLLTYGANRRNATLYEAYLVKTGDQISVTIGQWATFTVGSSGLVPDELPGGLATHQRLINAERRIAREHTVILTDAEVDAAHPTCVWKP